MPRNTFRWPWAPWLVGAAAITWFLPVPVAQATEPGQPLVAGLRWTYSGRLARAERDGVMGPADKTFRLELIALPSGGDSLRLGWIVEEQGRGQWPWTDRAGEILVATSAVLAAEVEDGPALLYEREEGATVIRLPLPLVWLPDDVLAGPLPAEWSDGKRQATLQQLEGDANRSDRLLLVRDPLGFERSLQLAGTGPEVRELQRRVFMGRGEPYRLVMQLQQREELPPDRLRRIEQELAALRQLRESLGRKQRSEELQLSQPQIAVLRERLADFETLVGGGFLDSLGRAAREDFIRQSARNDDVAALVERFVGKPAASFEASGLQGARLSGEELKDRVTVLHFWDYRDEPLKEPYGQVGYLDFLYEKYSRANRQNGPTPVQIFGVAVRRMTQPDARRAATRSVSKLQAFMNLRYPILLDDGRLLKQFGDPRSAGAALPLFVVIDPQGRVVHYHVGNYQVEPHRGLEELDRVIAAAAGS